jgi:hypothetical protein
MHNDQRALRALEQVHGQRMPVLIRHPQVGHHHIELNRGDFLGRFHSVASFIASKAFAPQSHAHHSPDGLLIVNNERTKCRS